MGSAVFLGRQFIEFIQGAGNGIALNRVSNGSFNEKRRPIVAVGCDYESCREVCYGILACELRCRSRADERCARWAGKAPKGEGKLFVQCFTNYQRQRAGSFQFTCTRPDLLHLFPLFQYRYRYPAYTYKLSCFIGDPDLPYMRSFSNANGCCSARNISVAHGADVVGVDFEAYAEMGRSVDTARCCNASQGLRQRHRCASVKEAQGLNSPVI